MTDELLWDDIDQAAKNAEQFATRSYFGRLSVEVAQRTRWMEDENGRRMPVEIDEATYRNLADRDRSIELLFSVDIQELKPDLEFTYDRKVSIGNADWNKIIIPSLKKLLGKDVMKGGTGKALQRIHGQYVHAKDVPQAKSPEYNTIRLEQIFSNKDECVAASNALFSGETVATPTVAGVATTGTGTPTPAPATSGDRPPGFEQDMWDIIVQEEIKPALQGGTPVDELAKLYKIPAIHILKVKKSLE